MIKVGILGDLILSDNLKIDDSIISVLNDTDFNIVNLEAPFIEKSWLNDKKVGLFQQSKDVNLLKKLNIKAVSLANNHIDDFGQKGLKKTIEKLKQENIKYFGAGNTYDEATNPAIITIRGKKIAFYGGMMKYFSNSPFAKENKFGVNIFNYKNFSRILKNTNSDYQIIYNHWNQEFEDYPEPLMKYYSEKLIDFCDAIIGSHPHCVQGIQIQKNKPIFYSLGNFAMPNIHYGNIFLEKYPEKCYKSIFIVLSLENKTISYKIFPLSINSDSTEIKLADEKESKIILQILTDISKPLYLKHSVYRRFYRKNKIRKLRFAKTKIEIFNSVITIFTLFILYSIVFFQRFALRVLTLFRLEKIFQRTFGGLLNKVNKIK